MCTKIQVNLRALPHTLKTTVLLVVPFLLTGCNPNFSTEAEPQYADSQTYVHPTEKEIDSLIHRPDTDSIQMHAFDNLSFGKDNISFSGTQVIDNMQYGVSCTKKLPDNRIYSFLLENTTSITSQKKANKILDELKSIISAKYNDFSILSRTFYTMDPEEREGVEACFSKRERLKYSRKNAGLPYEYAAYVWDLKYKTIQIGYFIQNSYDDKNNYTVYIEFTSKVLKNLLPEKDNPDARKTIDARKF